MKERYFFSFTVLLAFFITSISLPSMALATEDVSIAHVVKNYVSDGPIATVTLNLQVQNNSGSVMNDVVIEPVPMAKKLFFAGAMDVYPISVESISVGASISVDYTITDSMILTQEEIAVMPIFWEVRYVDGTGQEKSAMVVSGISTEEGGL